ncbi:flavodoxin-dependent (E)-4-hydroxy-3-methylbut-2-enyl-diphosphate synthase [Brevibacillus sp. 7WMA2]|uniref:4-hydroxy-3-methylbut-2-en-1-yl diphosphate synthase (flavodoxin) n=1 Tax=Brevibacillus laterosporus LMG 15441 TaxID=1042163 RepID=A0A075R847_BRELA|nr:MULTISPECIES: flavodoxin-dependent (E)-4-hydroxy-3-methylbut-2-enyl-diphosphate synthase [Brevibacillus]AIG27576.1 4-hydroxy-3-methylbut-2-en-1-yl diphosphate synthase [Brevibacillus laterosporus LMG 15441]AUM65859.1 flavodoxin-dependent (E)-4-hydroxy-3-methylbut-2-enyl-diphosphate synthase [Brevibacillus laterosporus]AYK08935.1 flavodoxin-dependent (E)-4-hydroxy-3-methylbut-2-enyl-diphosphate synthase [Brevibacillus laterosporus]ERM19525.1 4-hydroxy-3-methylbut-2-en-1-yl diphosphate synthas
MYKREETKPVFVGGVQIGGQKSVVIQSMTTADTRDVEATLKQIEQLHEAGCQIVRLAVVNEDAAKAIKQIKERSPLPLVADIHFDYRLALTALESGIDKIRINPGNIGNRKRTQAVVDACRERNVPIRIGVNSGSVERRLIDKYGYPSPEAIVESAMNHVEILEDLNYDNITISLKSSDVPTMIQTYSLMAERRPYPLHVGVTEAGTQFSGSIKSAVGIGTVLSMGIGDTIRVSLTADPVEEIKVAKQILRSLDIVNNDPVVIACPSCGRCAIDLIGLATKVEDAVSTLKKPLKVAVMGCAVNGPGEAREADVGVAGGNGEGLIFRNGEIVRKVKEDELFEELMKEINTIMEEK